jgi:hypothetical protein
MDEMAKIPKSDLQSQKQVGNTNQRNKRNMNENILDFYSETDRKNLYKLRAISIFF